MKASVQRLRWILAGGAVLLLAVLAVFAGYGRYRALKVWRDIVGRSGVHITQETDSFTYSQSLQGRTVFTLHAAKAIQHSDGKWALHNVVLTLYGKTGDTVDHVSGSDFEYDSKTGVARAIGEVLMDIEPPGTVPVGGRHSSGSAPPTPAANHVIHVRTSNLVFARKLSVAATDQPVEFRYDGMECTSQGAEFDAGEDVLRLLANVQLTGAVHGQPTVVHAASAQLNRDARTATLTQPVVSSQGRTGKAASAVLHLRPDGSIAQAEAAGGVVLDAGTRHITAAALESLFSPSGQPQSARLSGSVVLTDTDASRPLQAQAAEVDASFDPLGAPTGLVATGSAQLALSDRKGSGPPLARELRGDRIVATLEPSGRKSVSRLSEIVVTGHAMARGESLADATAPQHSLQRAALRSTQVSADSLRAVFAPNPASGELSNPPPDSSQDSPLGSQQSVQLSQLFGQGHTLLQQDAPDGEQQTSSANSLVLQFAPRAAGNRALAIASATQAGDVRLHNRPSSRTGSGAGQAPSDAAAQRATYDGATSVLTLSGDARFTQGQTSLMATTIVLHQRSGDADADGSVLATLSPDEQTRTRNATPNAAARSRTAEATHITAARAYLAHGSQFAEFQGSDAYPARLWQGASQVEAALLYLDRKSRSLTARPASPGGLVHAIFAAQPQPKTQPKAQSKVQLEPAASAARRSGVADTAQFVRVASPTMNYNDLTREAAFSGGVRMDGSAGSARAQRAVVFLQPAPPASSGGQKSGPPLTRPSSAAQPGPFAGSLQRIVLSGDVRLEQPGRSGAGEQLVYTAADRSFILTGTPAHPPRLADARQGSITGATLLFHQGESTIIVAGAPPSRPGAKPGRVRTETVLKDESER